MQFNWVNLKTAPHLKRVWAGIISMHPKINRATFSKNNFQILLSLMDKEGKETHHDSPSYGGNNLDPYVKS